MMSYEYLLLFENIIYLIKSVYALIFKNSWALPVYKIFEKLTVDFHEPGAGPFTALFLVECESPFFFLFFFWSRNRVSVQASLDLTR